MKEIIVINGPNLNLLGKREPILYGSESFESFFEALQKLFPKGKLRYEQTNSESEMIDVIHKAADSGVAGIVLNPAAYSHSSIAVGDAVAAVDVPVVEVHISNVFGRETHRQHSYVSKYAAGVIVGFGLEGYRLAVDYLLRS